MTKVSELSAMRKEVEAGASQPFVEYISKYMEKVEDKSDGSKKLLQKLLRSIGEWDSSKVDREYSKFLKWCTKRDITVDHIKDNLTQFVVLSLRIMLNKRIQNDNTKEYEIDITELFYKCMRRVARRLYENVRDGESYLGKRAITDIIVSCLHEFIPLERLIEIIELFEKDEDSNHSYDFNRTFSDSEDGKILVEKESSDKTTKESGHEEPALQYVPSDNFEDEYYNADDKKNSEDENVKEIKIPKYNGKGYYNKKPKEPIRKPKVNEKDENFFSD